MNTNPLPGYDAWKLDSGYDERDDFEDYDDQYCQHHDFEIDWQGIGTCENCGYSWFASPEECARFDSHQARIEKDYQHHLRWRHWYTLKAWIKHFNPWRDKRDDIPF